MSTPLTSEQATALLRDNSPACSMVDRWKLLDGKSMRTFKESHVQYLSGVAFESWCQAEPSAALSR